MKKLIIAMALTMIAQGYGDSMYLDGARMDKQIRIQQEMLELQKKQYERQQRRELRDQIQRNSNPGDTDINPLLDAMEIIGR